MGVDALTVEQLHSVNIDFHTRALESVFPYLAKKPEYFHGIFFADIEPKGRYLLNLLKNAPQLSKKIIFIDDKASQVESVAKALDQLRIPHECYIYSLTDEKGKSFDPLIANIELYYFYESDGKTILSDQEAMLIAKNNPQKDAEYYLRATLKIARLERLKLTFAKKLSSALF